MGKIKIEMNHLDNMANALRCIASLIKCWKNLTEVEIILRDC